MKSIANPLGEALFAWTDPSGLRVRVLNKPGFSKTHAALVTRFGAVDRRLAGDDSSAELPDGLAHFLEHQMFEDENGDVAARFARLGAAANAFTSLTHTSYVFETSSNVPECVSLLLDLVLQPYFKAESVTKEIAVIAREIRMYDNDPSSRNFQNLLGVLYAHHPARVPIAGTEATIAAITPDLLYRTHAEFYGPNRLVLSIVGDVDVESLRARIEARLQSVKKSAFDSEGDSYPPNDDARPTAPEIRIAMDVVRPKWLLGIKDPAMPFDGPALLRRELSTGVLLDSMFSPSAAAHERWLDAGLVDDSFGFDYNAEPGFGFVAIAADLDVSPAEGEQPALELAIRDEIHRVLDSGIAAADFERVRRKQLGRFVTYFDHLESLASSLAQSAFLDLTPFDWILGARELTRDDIDRRARELFVPALSARSIVVPARSGE